MQHFSPVDIAGIELCVLMILVGMLLPPACAWLARRRPMARFRRHKRGTLPPPSANCRRGWQEFAGRR